MNQASRVIEVNDGTGDIYLGGAFTRLSKCSVPCRWCESRHELLDLRFISSLPL